MVVVEGGGEIVECSEVGGRSDCGSYSLTFWLVTLQSQILVVTRAELLMFPCSPLHCSIWYNGVASGIVALSNDDMTAFPIIVINTIVINSLEQLHFNLFTVNVQSHSSVKNTFKSVLSYFHLHCFLK